MILQPSGHQPPPPTKYCISRLTGRPVDCGGCDAVAVILAKEGNKLFIH